MKDVIIFDIGGVLRIYENDAFDDWLRETFSITVDIRSAWKKWQDLRDIDAIDEHKFYKYFLQDIDLPYSALSEREFYRKFFDEHVMTNEKMFNLIEKHLWKKYRLYIFSNMSRIEIREHKKKIDYEKFFDHCVYSCNIGKLKPNCDFFEKGLKEIGCKGDECLFVDDKTKNRKNSEKYGITFVQYGGHEEFVNKMELLGFI
jgi:HAD superfamily hydrolase (TIGR01509 family)